VSRYEKSERTTSREESKRRRPFGRLVHFSPKGIVAVSQYRKVGVNFIPAGGSIRATFGRLEPYDGKLSRTVLRGERGGNTPDLPGDLPLVLYGVFCTKPLHLMNL